jgi:hypothetical protein
MNVSLYGPEDSSLVPPTLGHMNPIYTFTEFLEYLALKKRALQTVERLKLFTQRHHVISQKI